MNLYLMFEAMLFGTYVIIREEKSFVYYAGLLFLLLFFFLMMFSGILNYFCLFTFGCPGSLLLPSLLWVRRLLIVVASLIVTRGL